MEFDLIYESDLNDAIQYLKQEGIGKRLSIVKISSKRSVAQNRLQRKWHLEAAEQLKDHTAEEYRAFCKLHFGVPILRMEEEVFKEKYDRIIKPHSHEEKLEMMAVPFDFPVTSIMSKDQKSRFLEAVYQHYTGLGVKLTEPDNEHI